jgi:hypothetical protein
MTLNGYIEQIISDYNEYTWIIAFMSMFYWTTQTSNYDTPKNNLTNK